MRRHSSLLLSSLLFALVPRAVAPKGEPSASLIRQCLQSPGTSAAYDVALMTGAAAAALATISTARTVEDVADSSNGRCRKPGLPVSYFCEADSSEGSDSNCESELCESCSEAEDGGAGISTAAFKTPSAHPGAGKLWTKDQFPEGVDGPANWDLDNLTAAQAWDCPCLDRRNCIGSERIPVLHLYEYRKKFRTTAKGTGGFRDTARKEMEERYDISSRTFMNQFKVGEAVDCCAASAALAKGLSFGTFAAARADVTKTRPTSEGRRTVCSKQESEERAHLNAYIRVVRGGSEGPKGGSVVHNKWHVAKQSMKQRWETYVKGRQRKKLPVIGSLGLFTKLWKEHTEIVETTAKGHPKCDRCGEMLADRAKYTDRTDAVGREWLQRCDKEQAEHDAEHLGERDYAEDWWLKAGDRPDLLTCASMDAPTETQFDVPMQRRTAHDVVKSLEGAKKWSSKIMGLMFAAHGMRVYAAREGLGSGANLSLTVLYLGLLSLVAANVQLGRAFHILLDNTSADNKNNEMIFFLAWLVLVEAFEETNAFMMIKGHTYSRIDQSFRCMIVQMMQEAVWCISMMLGFLFKFLAPYQCLGVEELPHLWDWKNFFKPHVHERLGGFATGQYGSGMHEIKCRKDAHGVVRVWFRKSSKASNWLPEGPGIEVFKSTPVGPPDILAAAKDTSWDRAGVESNVNAWYKYMHVNQTMAAKIRAEWDARFAALPPDGDTTQLPDESKLKWADLPKRKSQPRVPAADFGPAYISNALENPPINPIHGLGRTEAEVAKDRRSHQNCMRREAAAPGYVGEAPVYQADFLFVKVKGQRDITLHRIAHDLAIDDATVKNITFTTAEYVHKPQTGYSGLFGTFTQALNPTHDPKDSKTGNKFIRRYHVERSDVVLYQVEVNPVRIPETATTKSHTALQLTLASLERLARVCPEFALPDELPPSHARDEETESPGAGPRKKKRKRRRAVVVQSDGDEGEGSAGDDVPPSAPDGWKVGAWEPGDNITNFMVWTQLQGEERRTWHAGEVTRTLARPTVREGFTHDVCLDGTTQRRGLALSADAYEAGVWVPLQRPLAEGDTAESPNERPASDTSDRNDDESPVPPDGWEVGAWEPEDDITNFMVWTQLPGDEHPTWHVGKVARTLARPTARGGYTHDVCLDGTTQKRGLALSSDSYEAGVWVLLQSSVLAITNTDAAEVSSPPRRSKRARR